MNFKERQSASYEVKHKCSQCGHKNTFSANVHDHTVGLGRTDFSHGGSCVNCGNVMAGRFNISTTEENITIYRI